MLIKPILWSRSSVGEHYVDIVGVTSSILVATTMMHGAIVNREPAG